MLMVATTVVRPGTARFTIRILARKCMRMDVSGAVSTVVYKHRAETEGSLIDLRYHAADHTLLSLTTEQLFADSGAGIEGDQ